jgi:hypothetical protein
MNLRVPIVYVPLCQDPFLENPGTLEQWSIFDPVDEVVIEFRVCVKVNITMLIRKDPTRTIGKRVAITEAACMTVFAKCSDIASRIPINASHSRSLLLPILPGILNYTEAVNPEVLEPKFVGD